MQVVVCGKDSLKRRLVECQVWWMIDYLGLSRSRYTLELVPKPGLRKTHLAGGLTGKKGNRIGLVVDTTIPVPYIFQTVAHEMIHVKQLAKGQLQYEMRRGKEVALWCGKKYDHLHYYDKPWEKEAFSKSEVLGRRFNYALNGAIENDKRKRKV